MVTMPNHINPAGSSGPGAAIIQEVRDTSSLRWAEMAERVSTYMGRPPAQGLAPGRFGQDGVGHLTDLLRLQMEVAQYQLRVELVAKVSESAVASLRKLQQTT